MRDREQIETVPTTAQRVMSHPRFAQGVADVRSGKGFPADYDTWAERDQTWSLLFGHKMSRPNLQNKAIASRVSRPREVES